MTALSLARVNFLLDSAACARANAVDPEVPNGLRRQWLEQAEHLTDIAHRELEQLAVQRWMNDIPSFGVERAA